MMTDIANIEARLDHLTTTVEALMAQIGGQKSTNLDPLHESIESLRSELADVKAGNRATMDRAIAQVQSGAKSAANSSMMQVAKQSVNLICEVEDKLENKIRSAKNETEDRLNAAKAATSKFEMLAEIQAQTASAHIIKYLAGRI